MEIAVNAHRQRMPVLLAWCLLLTLTWGLWLWQLDASDLTFDETATYFVAYRPPLDILNYLRGAVREHPPVYYLLVRGWMALVGTSEFSLRLFSVGAGLVAVALAGWVARLALPRPSARLASLLPAALLAVLPGMVYYARDARMYSLGISWTMLSAGFFLRDWLAPRGWPRRIALVSLVGANLLALSTHYYLLLPILVQPLVLLITRRWRPLLAWCATHLLPALAGLAWLGLSPGLQMTTGGLWQALSLTLPTSFQLLHLLGKLLSSPVVSVNLSLLYRLLALTGGGVLVALWRRRAVGTWLLLILTLPLVLACVLPNPPTPRYLIFLTPFTALALGYLCTLPFYVVKHRWLAWSLALVLATVNGQMLAAGGLRSAITFERSIYGRTLKLVQAHARPGDGVLFYGPWQWIQFHYYDPGDLPPITTLPAYAPPHLDPAEAEPVLEKLASQYQRLWVLPAAVDDVDPAHFVEGWLRTHTHCVWQTNHFSLCLPPLPDDAPRQEVGAAFGETLYLERVAYESPAVPAGEPLRLALRWKPLLPLENDVLLTLVLADPGGQIHNLDYTIPGEWAAPPSTWEPGQTIVDYEGLMIPQGALPGEYIVRLRVDDLGADETLPVGGAQEMDLLKVQVTGPIAPVVLYGLPNASAARFCAPDGADCITLAGYEPGGVRFQQGYPVPFKLHWLVPNGLDQEIQLHLKAIHRSWLGGLRSSGIVTGTFSLPTAGLDDPTAPTERLVTLQETLMLPPDAATGPAQVVVEVTGPDGTPWQTAEGHTAVSLFRIIVENRPALRKLPGGVTPIQVDFGDEVGLRGYRVEGNARPGGQLHITHIWYARTSPTEIYAVFNHLVAPNGETVAQADGWPQEGRMLSIQWQRGEYVEDHHTLDIPPGAPPGPYTLYVGLYNAASGDRLLAFQNDQRLPDDRLTMPLPGEGTP